MDIVLGVSMAPTTVRMVLVEGENADGVTVDEDDFDLNGVDDGPTPVSGPNQVIAAILGTRESAVEGGYQLTSTGVTFSDQIDAAVLRDALADHKIENVMLVSTFLAAAALTQAVGGAIGYARTALMFVEPATATLAVVDSADGSIAGVRRQRIVSGDGVAELTEMVAGLDGVELRPDGVFVVGSGVEIASIKPRLEAVTSLPVSVPEEPESALARGAALASAHAPLFASSTSALAWAQDPGTGEVDPGALVLDYAYVPDGVVDHDATQDIEPLAYSAVPDYTDAFSARPDRRERTPFLLAGSALAALFIIGIAALVISLAVDIRPSVGLRPDPGGNAVVPTKQAPAPPHAQAPTRSAPPGPPPPSVVPAPPPPIQQPAPVVRQAPSQAVLPQRRVPVHRSVPAAPAPVPAPLPAAPPPPPPAAPPPPPAAQPPPRAPAMPPMTVWLHLPFVTIPIPINPPPPSPPPPG